MKPSILVTGFTAFHNFSRNPSGDIAEAVNGKKLNGFMVHGIRLPVSWYTAWPIIKKKIDTLKPAAWIGLGLAPDPFIRLETTARNEAHHILDELGQMPPATVSGEIMPGKPATIPSTLPLEWLREKLLIRNFTYLQTYPLEVRYSDDAGAYICNHVFYLAMNEPENNIPVRGFIHVPPYSVDSNNDLTDQELIEVGAFIVSSVAEWLSGVKDRTM